MPLTALRNKEAKLIMTSVTVLLWKIYFTVEITEYDGRLFTRDPE